MKWLNKLERKYGRYAIQDLMKYIVGANLAVFLLDIIVPGLIYNLTLIPERVMQGEIWRLVTFVIVPPTSGSFWILITLYFYFMIGRSLEQEWGSFKFNVYYFTGVIFTIIVSMVTGVWGSTYYLNLTLFLAFATIYPEYEVMLFMILPIKMKYLAIIYGVLLLEGILTGGMPAFFMIGASLANYFIFFWNDFLAMVKLKKKVRKNQSKHKVVEMKNYYRHRCSVCGITEKDDPDMEFRYCSKCNGHKEYCMNHLKNHEHV